MRGRTSASCFCASALVSALERCASGIVDISRCGLTKAVACGMATWEWMSMVVLFGRTSRPGLPCLRAAVASYLLHCVAISASFLLSARGWFAALYFFDRIILSEKSATFRDDALEH